MNRKAQTLGISIVVAIFIFIIGLSVVNLIMPEITQFRTDMSCSDAANISDATKLTCLAGDTVVFYFILLVFSISVGGIIARFVL
jgi:hypothetical protein